MMQSKGFIVCDWGYIFDYYSILVVKNQKRLIRQDVVDECKNVIIAQIGRDKFIEIVQSDEFNDLCNKNSVTFDLVEKARKEDDGLAHWVDESNMQRYYAKVAIQKKFFGSEPSIEKKS